MASPLSTRVIVVRRKSELLYLNSVDNIPAWTTQVEQALEVQISSDLMRRFPAASFFPLGLTYKQKILVRARREQITPFEISYVWYKESLEYPSIKEHRVNVRIARELIESTGEDARVKSYRSRDTYCYLDPDDTSHVYGSLKSFIAATGHNQYVKAIFRK